MLPAQGDSPGALLEDYTQSSKGLMIPNYVDDLLPPDKIKALIKSGHVVQVGSDELSAALSPGALPPGAEVRQPPPAEVDLTKRGAEKGIVQAAGQPTMTSERLDQIDRAGGRTAAKSAMVLDPKKLKGKTIEQLNSMILERDPTLEPAKSTDEAISVLSKDFEG